MAAFGFTWTRTSGHSRDEAECRVTASVSDLLGDKGNDAAMNRASRGHCSRAWCRTYVTQSLSTPGFKIHWVSQKPMFSPDGKMAYMRGTDEMTVPGPKGAPMTLHLQGYSIWRKDADGQWRCVVDVANEAPVAAAPAR